MQKYRADGYDAPCQNGSIAWYAKWIGGPTYAKIEKCPTPYGPRMVYITGEADTFYSLPAKCKVKGKVVVGWVGRDDDGWYFRVRVNK